MHSMFMHIIMIMLTEQRPSHGSVSHVVLLCTRSSGGVFDLFGETHASIAECSTMKQIVFETLASSRHIKHILLLKYI